jgi:hypothetical protein
MRAMIEREVAGQQDDDLRIEISNFDPHGDRLSAPVEFTIGIQAEPDVATQRKVVVSSFGSARTTEPSPIWANSISRETPTIATMENLVKKQV